MIIILKSYYLCRKLNDNMYKEVTKKIFKQIKIQKLNKNLKILIMGYTFKENCSDIRNSQIIKIKDLISKYYYTDITILISIIILKIKN